MSELIFTITQRHYEMIIRQTLENQPQESGGFLGGKDFTIKAVMPVYNQHLYNKTDTFAITQDDVLRAHDFFAKHGLDYYGVYHSHPKGIAEPSQQDLSTNNRYHFIVGLRNPQNPEFNAFQAFGYRAQQIPIRIIDNKGITVLELHGGQKKENSNDLHHEMGRLSNMIDDIKKDRAIYPKLSPSNPFDSSNFNTLA